MNRTMKTGIIFFILVFAFLSPSCVQEQTKPRLITVTGDAEVRVTPDEVILTIGVETSDKNLNIAKSKNDKLVKKVLALAKEYNIEPKHIQTNYLNIEPRYRYMYEEKDFIGYFIKKTIVFTLKDISKFEDLLSSVLKTGANYVHGIQFRTTELRKHKDQARSLAIKAAQEKAIDLATELGQKISKPHTIQEEQSGWWSYYNSWWGSRWGGGMAQNVVQNVGQGPATTEGSIALGQITVNARITVSFELE